MSSRPSRPAVPLAAVPGVSRLSVLHASGADEARAFLPDPFDLETIRSRAALVRSRWRPAPGRNAEPGLEELATGRRAVVTAGQQVGLFTGPLLTLAKAAAALSLARELGRSGEEAGALFWCASEDHDLVEVTRVLLPGPDGPRDAGPGGGPLEANRAPVGGLPVPGGLEEYLETLRGAGAPPPFQTDAEALVALSAGKTFLAAFVDSMRWLLPGQPIAYVDAARREEKPLLVPLARRLVLERDEVRRILAERAAALAAASHPPQVKSEPAALPLFAIVDGRRLLLREEGGRFTLKGDDGRAWREEEVVERFEGGDWLPSFSALTRPLAASTLFPVAASVLGPAEVAYWAQMIPLFDWAGLERPVVVPRPMVLPVDGGARRLLARTGLAPADLFAGRAPLLAARGAGSASTLLGRLAESRDAALSGLGAFEGDLVALDPGLGKALETTRQNVTFAFGKLAEKVSASAGRADEEWTRSLDRLLATLLPGGRLAERIFSPLPFLARYGREALSAAILGGVRWDAAGLLEIDL